MAGAIALLAAGGLGFWWTARGTGPAVGTLRIDSQPSGASVTLDGELEEGTTPMVIRGVPRGRHALEVRLSGHTPREATFDLERDRLELSYVLSPVEPAETDGEDDAPSAPPGEETVARAPPEADGSSDGAETAGTSDATAEAGEPTAEQAARAERPRRRPRVRGTAQLNLLSRPWATVTIQGRQAGRTPLVGYEIPAGRVLVELRARGEGPPKRLVVRARPGTTVNRRVTFE